MRRDWRCNDRRLKTSVSPLTVCHDFEIYHLSLPSKKKKNKITRTLTLTKAHEDGPRHIELEGGDDLMKFSDVGLHVNLIL